MGPSERRRKLIEVLSIRRYDTMEHLADELGVCWRTIYRDIQDLSLTYPLYTTRGTYGGVHMMDGFRLDRKFLTPVQQKGLEELLPSLTKQDQELICSILDDFALKK